MSSRTCRHRRVPWHVAAALLLIAAGWSSAAEEPASIRGRVVDREGRPVASATVTVAGSTTAASSDSDGRFELTGVPAGRHRLEASCPGFTGEIVDGFVVAAGEAAEVTFRLTALEVPLKEIVVTASASLLREESVAVVALDRKQITELPHFGDDLYRAITVLPGVSGGDFSARFSIRGGLYDETLVTLDDQELMEPFHLKDFQGVFSILDPEMIGGVELTPGGFTAVTSPP